jgi:hypothetical protein
MYTVQHFVAPLDGSVDALYMHTHQVLRVIRWGNAHALQSSVCACQLSAPNRLCAFEISGCTCTQAAQCRGQRLHQVVTNIYRSQLSSESAAHCNACNSQGTSRRCQTDCSLAQHCMPSKKSDVSLKESIYSEIGRCMRFINLHSSTQLMCLLANIHPLTDTLLLPL